MRKLLTAGLENNWCNRVVSQKQAEGQYAERQE